MSLIDCALSSLSSFSLPEGNNTALSLFNFIFVSNGIFWLGGASCVAIAGEIYSFTRKNKTISSSESDLYSLTSHFLDNWMWKSQIWSKLLVSYLLMTYFLKFKIVIVYQSIISESYILHYFFSSLLPPEALLCHLQLWNSVSKKWLPICSREHIIPFFFLHLVFISLFIESSFLLSS